MDRVLLEFPLAKPNARSYPLRPRLLRHPRRRPVHLRVRELSPHLHKGESFPDVALLTRLVRRKLKTDIDRLSEADRAHELELSDDSAPREARDAAAEKVRSALVEEPPAADPGGKGDPPAP